MGTLGKMGFNNSTERNSGRHRLAALVLGAAVLAGTAACTGTSTPSASGGGTSPATTAATGSGSGSTGTNSAPASPTTAGSTSATIGAHATSGSGSGSAAACTGAQIKVAYGRASAATNHRGNPVTFTNIGSHTCTLRGYPGVAIVSGSKTLLNATRELNGFIGDQRTLTATPVVTLAPGAVASAMVESVGDAGEKCYPDGAGTFEVTPPNTTTTTSLGSWKVGHLGVCADFEVHPVVLGLIGY